MKPITTRIWMFIALLCLSISASAYDFEINGLYYDIISVSDKTCALTNGDSTYSGVINIPDSVSVNGRFLKVISIKEGTFEASEKIEELSIPSSVVNIDGKIFYSKGSLIDKLNITYGVNPLVIGGYRESFYPNEWVSSFKNCNPKEVYLDREVSSGFSSHESIEKLTIGRNLNSINAAFFCNCKNLNQLIIEDCSNPLIFSDQTYPSQQFGSCPLNDVYLGRNFQFSISPFKDKTIKNLTLGTNVTILEEGAFQDCVLLSSVDLGNIEEIGARAFNGCKQLLSPNFPPSITKLGDNCFSGCDSIKELNLDCNLNTIPKAAFSWCRALKSVKINGRVRIIEEGAFTRCYKLSSIILGDGIESIGYGVFEMTAIDSIILPNSLKIIESSAFMDCYNLKKIIMGPNIERIGENAFNSNYSHSIDIDSIVIKAIVPPSIEESTFTAKTYLNCVVKVPSESENAYKNADCWKNFWNIEGCDFPSSGIENIEYTNSSVTILAENGSIQIMNKDDGRIVRVYSIHGTKIAETPEDTVHNLSEGIYIVTVGTESFKVVVR